MFLLHFRCPSASGRGRGGGECPRGSRNLWFHRREARLLPEISLFFEGASGHWPRRPFAMPPYKLYGVSLEVVGESIWFAFSPGRKQRSRCRPADSEGYATGIPHLDGFESTIQIIIPTKNTIQSDGVFCWWGKVDSNHRSDKQQIYSLSPLATREFPHILFVREKRWSR